MRFCGLIPTQTRHLRLHLAQRLASTPLRTLTMNRRLGTPHGIVRRSRMWTAGNLLNGTMQLGLLLDLALLASKRPMEGSAMTKLRELIQRLAILMAALAWVVSA